MPHISIDRIAAFTANLGRATLQLRSVSLLREASRNTSGNISILAGFSLLPLFTCVGMGVDYGRAHYVQTRMQTSLDAAVLAGGRSFQMTSDVNAAELTARGYFNSQFAGASAMYGQPQITGLTIDLSTYTITAKAGNAIPTPFLGIAGISRDPDLQP